MQLAQLPVGRGVAESKVDSGNLYKHPIKRARTTFGYVMIAVFGTDEERAALGRRGDRGAPPGPLGPGRPRALHRARPEAAALGGRLHLPRLRGRLRAPLRPAAARAARPHLPPRGPAGHHAPGPGRPCGRPTAPPSRPTGPRRKPASRWTKSPAPISTTSPHSGSCPGPCPRLFGWFHRAVTAGFLPAAFRRELGLAWGAREQRAFALNRRFLRIANALTPRPLRALPFDLYLWDMRRRIRNGRHIL